MTAELDLDDVAAQSKKAAAELAELRVELERLRSDCAEIAVLLGDVAAERERCAMICDKAAEMAWSRWEIMADQFDQGAAAEAEKLANAIREGQELEQRRESPAR